ncbi:MAG: DUF4492 domain-containing protein [Mangrovibacterium sp.]
MQKNSSLLKGFWEMYIDGFKHMSTWGKQVWLIIIIKLIIMFLVLKLFFFPDFLKTNFRTNEQRADHVLEQIINTK